MSTATEDAEVVQRFKTELEALKKQISACKTVHDYLKLTEEANGIARRAAAACRKKALLQEPAPAAAAAAEAGAAAAAAAGGGASSIGSSVLSQLPENDDGVTCMLLRLPKGWGPPRLQAFIERFGAKPSQVTKNSGDAHALVVFESPEQRTLFYEEFRKAEQEGGSTGSAGQFLVKFPGAGKPQQQLGLKRPAADSGAAAGDGNEQQQKRPAKLPKTDIRQVVCPWWDRPYKDQLNDKMVAVKGTLRLLSEKVAQSYGRYEKPEWLTAALRQRGKEALPLPGIARSPQVNGYRNKAEFTVGLDGSDQPTVGFLLGNYVDGVTQVADPSGCRHMSPTSLAYAAAMNTFLRSSASQLPAWDKRRGKGFWRLLTVREGRDSSFLPLPTSQAATDGTSGEQQRVLEPTLLAEVPTEKWLVKNPEVAVGYPAGIELAEVNEDEPAAPPPAQVIIMVQIDPTAATGPDQIREQLQLLGASFKQAAAQQNLPLTHLLVQYHSGVANAAPQSAPLTLFPGEPGAEAGVSDEGKQVGTFSDVLCEVKFRVSPNAFFQINGGATCLLYHTVGRMAGVNPETLLLDVCCGTGTIGITLAKQVAAVIGIDNVENAIADAHVNASLNGITNATFVCGAAENVMEDILKEHAPKHSHLVAVVDPPRAGLHRNVLRALLGCAALKRLVFVSCNPDSLVQNASLLCSKYRPDIGCSRGGDRQGRGNRNRPVESLPPMAPYNPFRPTQVLAFDLFPHTKHVEVVMLFERD